MDDWIMRLIHMVVTVVSPELRDGIAQWVNELDAQAKKTSNPWDDIFVAVLKSVLFVKKG